MNQSEATENAVKEMIDRGLINPYKSEDIKFYCNMIYTIGFESGSRSRSMQKPVIQIDKYGNELRRFESVAQAARSTGTDNSSIVNVCKSTQHKAGGFLWKYATG